MIVLFKKSRRAMSAGSARQAGDHLVEACVRLDDRTIGRADEAGRDGAVDQRDECVVLTVDVRDDARRVDQLQLHPRDDLEELFECSEAAG